MMTHKAFVRKMLKQPAVKAEYHAQAFIHPLALGHGIDAEHHRIGRQGSRTNPQHRAPVAQMIEMHDTLGHVEGVMIGNRDHTGAEADSLGPLCRRDQEHLGRSDGFPTSGMMFSDPEFVEVQLVEPRRQFQIALKLEGRVLADWMVGREKHAEPKTFVHCRNSS